MTKTALIILADGFEEIEAISVIDILRRAQIDLTVAGLTQLKITSARKLIVEADLVLTEASSQTFDVIILPGGEPGTTNLETDLLVEHVLKEQALKKGWIAAICAAPRILDQLGLLNGIKATSFPGTKPKMKNCVYLEDSVVVDENVITSRGAGTAMAFAYEIVTQLKGHEITQQLQQSMVFRP